MSKHTLRPLLVLAMTALLAAPAWAQHRVTTPEQHFGHEIGADYVLPNYVQLHAYWIKLANESDRMILDTIGFTEEGRPQIQAIISSPENLRNLDRYKDISRRMAKARGIPEDEARRLADEGKAVIWIDGGLHATEVLGAQQLTELVFRMNDRTDAETLRILDDVILLATHANPDGHAHPHIHTHPRSNPHSHRHPYPLAYGNISPNQNPAPHLNTNSNADTQPYPFAYPPIAASPHTARNPSCHLRIIPEQSQVRAQA